MSIEFFSRYKHKITNIKLLKKKIKKKRLVYVMVYLI